MEATACESQSVHIPGFNVQHTIDTPIYHVLYGLRCKDLAEEVLPTECLLQYPEWLPICYRKE